MATQVTYKGSTIASFANTTKTLKTSGKYMEGDVAITEAILLQSKTVTPTTTSQVVTPDSGYEGLSKVTVEAAEGGATFIWDEEDSHGGTIRYISTGNAVSGTKTITAAGTYNVASYYSATVGAGTATTPATTITTNPGFTFVSSTGKLTAAYTGSSNVTPTIVSGYVTAGTSGKITTTGTSTYTLTTKAAATITPGTTDQTIASNQWLTGVQTIKGDANLVAGNIINGKTIFGVSGTYAGIIPTGTVTLTGANSQHNVSNYQYASVKAGTATTPATTITTNPTVTISNTTGIVTATYTGTSNVTPTVASGWVAAGTSGTITATGTKTLQLTSKGAATYNPSETAQTIASYQWLTGTQTIAAVSNTYVGTSVPRKSSADVTFASATGTFTAPIGYYSAAATKTITTQAAQTINTSTADQTIASYRWLTGTQTIKSVTTTNLTAANIAEGVVVKVGDANNASRILQITGTHQGGITPTGTKTITAAGSQIDVAAYQYASVGAGTATTPATTITMSPAITISATTGKITASYERNQNVTPTITSGYISEGTAGLITTTGTSTYTMPTQGGGTWYVSTANRTISSARWLTGDVNIKSVTTTNLLAENIAEGVVVKVGDDVNASRIIQVTGTHTGGIPHTILLSGLGGSTRFYVTHNGTQSWGNTASFTFQEGDELIAYYYHSSTTQNLRFYHDYKLCETVPAGTTGLFSFDYTSYLKGADYYFTAYTGANSTVNLVTSSVYNPFIYYAYYTLDQSNSEITDWIAGLSNIRPFAFAGMARFSSSTSYWNFQNVGYVNSRAFEYEFLTAGSSFYVNFPNCSTFYGSVFYNNGGLKGISAPVLTSIGAHCFYCCTSLPQVSFPKCSSIGSLAFYSCTSLSEVNFPECTVISNSAFGSCSYLTNISFPSCSKIGLGAFMNCYRLPSANFPECSYIGISAFTYCSALATISFPECLSIESNAFYGCSALTTVSFPKCTIVSGSAFVNCFALTTITFNECTSLGTSAFYNCSNLSVLNLSKVSSIGTYCFYKCGNIKSVTNINFPSLTRIAGYAFGLCSGISNVYLPETTSIGMYAFSSCDSLTKAYLPKMSSTVETVLQKCSNLTAALFGSISAISTYAFSGCYNLLSLYIITSNVPTLAATNAFNSTPISTYTTSTGGVYGSIYVRQSLLTSFQAATNWKTYSSRIVGLTDAQIQTVINNW